jgi:hypothetical protein
MSDGEPSSASTPAKPQADPDPRTIEPVIEPEPDDEETFLSWKLLVAVAVVLAVLAVGAWALFGGRKGTDNAQRTSSTAAGSQELPAIRDDFDRPDNATTLGKSTTGEDWEAVTGTWGVANKQAYLAAKNTNGPRNMAVVDLGTGDGSVQAKANKLVDGWGLAFRVRGPNAWWALKAVPKAATFNLVKFQDGNEIKVDNVGLTKLGDDTTVRVEFVGDTITVFLNGNAVRTIQDSYLLSNGTKAGLFADGAGATEARWSEFVAKKGSNGPPVTAAPKPGTPGPSTASTAPGASSTTRPPGGPSTTRAGSTTTPASAP